MFSFVTTVRQLGFLPSFLPSFIPTEPFCQSDLKEDSSNDINEENILLTSKSLHSIAT